METYRRKRNWEAGDLSNGSSGNESSTDKRPHLEAHAMVIDMGSPFPTIELRDYSIDLDSPSLSLLDIASTASSQDQRSVESASYNDIDDGNSPSRSSSQSLFRGDHWLAGAGGPPFTHENSLLACPLSSDQQTSAPARVPYGVCFGMLSAKIIDQQFVTWKIYRLDGATSQQRAQPPRLGISSSL
ncbi:hypothetical protein BDD12DRAFT_262117 [Trichophaea hybrida]|nr:hypothetical protein BDD12DRAFT_262117 [Trichophaea hybrida]